MRMLVSILLSLVCVSTLSADVLPPGHASVSHKLVFEASDLLKEHRLVAAPTAGFGTAIEVVPGKPFHFSSKYGTCFYVVPRDDSIKKYDRDAWSVWPASKPPVNEIKSVPRYHPVRSAETTLRITDVTEEGPVVEVVSHREFDARGRLVEHSGVLPLIRLVMYALPLILGVLICGFLFWFRSAKHKVPGPVEV